MQQCSQRTTLIAGGAGFLGFNLAKRLLAEGERVLCLDDMSTGLQEHVDELSRDSRFDFIRHDVTEPIELRVERIFNLASPASPPDYQADPIKTTLTNVVGMANMLELARSNGARLVQASTSEVYGDPLEHPQTENYRGNVSITGPRACYDEGKRCAETLVYSYRHMHRTDARVARIFNTYGPGMRSDDGRVVSNFILEALQGHDVTIYGDGSNTRSMCYVDDMVEGLLRLMAVEHEHSGPMNLGNPREISVLGLARLVIEMTGSSSRITFLPEAADDPHVRRPDISRAQAALCWSPKVSLEQGLQPTIAYFRKRLQEHPARRERIASVA